MDVREIIPFVQPLDLRLTLPGSKSITNRALLCAALARGTSRVTGALRSDDTAVMIRGLRQMGISIEEDQDVLVIRGGDGLPADDDLEVFLGNAGTATRFLSAAAVARRGETTITGDERMQERPIADLVEGLQQIGAKVTYLGQPSCPPIRIVPAQQRDGAGRIHVQMNGDKSSQYFSAILMVAPLLGLPVQVDVIGDLVSKPYIDITCGVMADFGVTVENASYRSFTILPQHYIATDYEVEGDASAATYFYALRFLHGGSLEFTNLDPATSIQGDAKFSDALASLSKGTIDMNAMPDAAMTLAVTAPFVSGTTEISNVANLRIKETDRLAALECEMRRIGFDVEAGKSSITVKGGAKPGASAPNRFADVGDTEISTYNDHRMAMSFAVVGSKIAGVVIRDPGCTSKTYPNFFDDLERAYLCSIPPSDRHIVLIGMRGAGKSYLGPKIATLLERKFIDVDAEIEASQGMSISALVDRFGWDQFRSIERATCGPPDQSEDSIFSKTAEPLVVASGGGIVLSESVMTFLKSIATIIFVFANTEQLEARIEKDSGRPALSDKGDSVRELRHTWQARRNAYRKYADYVWDNTSGKIVEANLGLIFQNANR